MIMKKLITLSFLSLIVLSACSKGEFDACGDFENGKEYSEYSVCLYKTECFVRESTGEKRVYDLDGTQVGSGEGTTEYTACMPTTEEFFNEIMNK